MPITSTNLPSPYPTRWVASRKATLVRDVQAGLLTLEEACAHYSIRYLMSSQCGKVV